MPEVENKTVNVKMVVSHCKWMASVGGIFGENIKKVNYLPGFVLVQMYSVRNDSLF